MLKKAGTTLYRLKGIPSEMDEMERLVKAAAGVDLHDLLLLRR